MKKTTFPLRPETEHALVTKDLEKEVRNEALLAHRAMGRSIREIAKLFEVSHGTAHRWVKEAQQTEQLKKAKGIVGERLIPKALAVYDQKLEEGDLEAARDILFGVGVLSKQQKIEVTREMDPLEAFRQKYFKPAEEPVIEVEKIPNE